MRSFEPTEHFPDMVPIQSVPILLSVGLADLTPYTGDGVRLVAAAAVSLSL